MPKSQVKQLTYGKRNYSPGHITKQVIPPKRLNSMTGWILMNDENDTVCARTLETLRRNGLADGVVEFKSGKEVTRMWEMFDGPMSGSVGYFNPSSVLTFSVYVSDEIGLGECCSSYLPSRLRRPKSRRDIPHRKRIPSNLSNLQLHSNRRNRSKHSSRFLPRQQSNIMYRSMDKFRHRHPRTINP
jgi:hypothetical protein